MVRLHALGRRIEEAKERLAHVVGLGDQHPLRGREDRVNPWRLRAPSLMPSGINAYAGNPSNAMVIP